MQKKQRLAFALKRERDNDESPVVFAVHGEMTIRKRAKMEKLMAAKAALNKKQPIPTSIKRKRIAKKKK